MKNIYKVMVYRLLRFSSHSEANASELLENLEEMFSRYCMYIDDISMFKSSITRQRVNRFQRVKYNISTQEMYYFDILEANASEL